MAETTTLTTGEAVQNLILRIRGEKVKLDSDLATMYGVEVKLLLRSVRRKHSFSK